LFDEAHYAIEALTAEMTESVIMPKSDLKAVIGCVVVGEAVLFEGVPGTGKTTLAKALAMAIGGDFSRVQGTPDVIPADITGGLIFNPKDREFHLNRGPIFTNVLLVDEANRLQSKTQSALLEAMQEKQVTIGTE